MLLRTLIGWANALIATAVGWATVQVHAVPPADQVRAIVSVKCIDCHYGAGPGPFALLSDADLKLRGPTMVKAVEGAIMPPWIASDRTVPMRDDCRLSESERAAFIAWRDAGYPAPTTAELCQPTEPPRPSDPICIGVAREWQPNPEDPDALRSFAIPLGNSSPLVIRGWRVLRDSPTLAVRYNLALTADQGALKVDEADPGPGYRRLGDHPGATSGAAGCIGIDGEFVLPDGFAFEVPAQAIIIAEVKSTGRGRLESAGAMLHALPAGTNDRRVREFAVIPDRSAPAQRSGAVVAVTTEPLSTPLDLVGVVLRPDMRARTVDLRVLHDDKPDTVLVDIPRYLAMLDRGYVLAVPLRLVSGDRISYKVEYDTPASALKATPAAVLLTADGMVAATSEAAQTGPTEEAAARIVDFSAARSVGIDFIELPAERGVHLARTEITQSQFEAVLGRNPSSYGTSGTRGKLPAETVSWYDAAEFCNELSRREHLAPAYELKSIQRDHSGNITGAAVVVRTSNGYRLPTEAQWKQASCFDEPAPQQSIDSADAAQRESWFMPWAQNTTHPVGSKSPNALGFVDLRGNVWEWCEDEWVDPAASGPVWRAVRGGAFCDFPSAGACDFRSGIPAGTRNSPFGFRVAVETKRASAPK